MKTYNVKTHLVHNSEEFEAGDEVELSEAQAEPLLAVGAVADPKAEKPAAPERAPKKVAKK